MSKVNTPASNTTATPDTSTAERRRRMWMFWIIAIALIIIYQVPYGQYILYPLMLISTFVHEMGHGITALIVGGEFRQFVMYADGSGAATYALSTPVSHLAAAATAAGGLLAPPFIAGILFFCTRSAKVARVALWIIVAILAISLILVVRNIFGFAFILLLLLSCGAIAKWLSNKWAQGFLLVGAISLAMAAFSRSDYLFTPTAVTAMGDMPSDVAQIANHLWLPYWFWGALIAIFSLAILAAGFKIFFYNAEHKKA